MQDQDNSHHWFVLAFHEMEENRNSQPNHHTNTPQMSVECSTLKVHGGNGREILSHEVELDFKFRCLHDSLKIMRGCLLEDTASVGNRGSPSSRNDLTTRLIKNAWNHQSGDNLDCCAASSNAFLRNGSDKVGSISAINRGSQNIAQGILENETCYSNRDITIGGENANMKSASNSHKARSIISLLVTAVGIYSFGPRGCG
mmetsp:Transcript_1678/g.3705  ORF Transcript_1678/g.3705 Transcript_1678/m.3705 type:complete len:201 (+) Transcript_1678:98-700(+)